MSPEYRRALMDVATIVSNMRAATLSMPVSEGATWAAKAYELVLELLVKMMDEK